MLQKTKSMLLKVLICLCLVCCLVAALVTAAACNKSDPTVVGGSIDSRGHLILEMSDGSTKDVGLVTGSNGSNGTDGTDGKDGVSIKDVVFDADGNLTVYLNDGSELHVAMPQYPETCPGSEDGTHAWVEVHKVVDANCISGETWFVACRNPGCQARYLKEKGEKNPTNHLRTEERGKLPTCTEDGYNNIVCLDCNATVKEGKVDKLGHTKYVLDDKGQPTTEENWRVVVDEGANVCVDGGQRVLLCGRCETDYVYDTEVLPVHGHHITEDWEFDNEPTQTAKGTIHGYCDVCGLADATVEVPALSDAKWEKGGDSGNCSEHDSEHKLATRTYTIKFYPAGSEESKPTSEGGLGWKQDTTIVLTKTSAVLHTFQGKQYTGALDDPTAIYDDTGNFQYFANSPNDCSTQGYAHFVCPNCENDILIKVIGKHEKGDKIEAECTAPTCTKPGEDVFACKNNPEHRVREEVPATGHTWGDPTITGNAPDITINLECTVCHEKEAIKAKTCTKNVGESTDPNCYEGGKIVYDYTYADPDNPSEDKSGKLEIELTKTNHSFMGFEFKKGVEYPNGQGPVYRMDDMEREGQPGILEALSKLDNCPVSCKTAGFMYIKCDHEHSEPHSQDVLVLILGKHSYERYPDGDKAATCTEAGQYAYKCSVCDDVEWRDKDDSGNTKPATGHSWDADIKEDGTITLTCKNNPAHKQTGKLDTTKGDDNTGIHTEEATCLKAGSKTYYILDQDNKSLEVKEDLPKLTTHKLGDLKERIPEDATKVFETYTAGEIIAAGGSIDEAGGFDNSHPTCAQSGFVRFTCSDCKKIILVQVYGDHTWKKLPGADKDGWVTVLPTCTTDGYTYRECENEGCLHPRQEKDKVPATGHTWKQKELVKPTAEQEGKLTRECSVCNKTEDYTLPVLSEDNYKIEKLREPTCISEGLYRYTWKNSTITDVSFDVTLDMVPHKLVGDEIKWTSKDGKYACTGHICDTCDQIILETKAPITVMEEPAEGEYLMSMFQAALNGGKGEWLYFTDEPAQTYYFAATTDYSSADTITVKKSGEDGYTLQVNGKYIEIVKSGTQFNVVLKDAQTEGSVWKWNSTYGIFTMEVDGDEYYMGTSDSQDTFSASAISHAAEATSYPAHLVKIGEATAAE